MEAVDLMERHEVDVALEERDVEEVQAAVEVHAAVREPRGVFNVRRGDRPVRSPYLRIGENRVRKHLQQGLDGVERAGLVTEFDADAARLHAELVALCGIAVGLEEPDCLGVGSGLDVRDFKRPSCGSLEALGEESHGAAQTLGVGVYPHGHILAEGETAFQHLEMRRERYDLRSGRLLRLGSAGSEQQRGECYESGPSHFSALVKVLVTVLPSGLPFLVKPRALMISSWSTRNGTPSYTGLFAVGSLPSRV